jgi:hypothetical protein
MTRVAPFAPGEGIASRIAWDKHGGWESINLDKVLGVMFLHKHFDLLSQTFV